MPLLLRVAAVALTASVAGGAATTAASVPQPTASAGADVPLAAVPYSVLGPRTVQVVVPVGGGCAQLGAADVEVAETATSVTVRASVRPAPAPPQDGSRGLPCPAVLRTVPVTVELAAPLGARTVVDGVGGRVVPPGAWPGLRG